MPKTTKPLTDKEVKLAKPKEKEYTLTDGYGLFLLVLPSGVKTWRFNYTRPYSKKRTKISLGIYPTVTLAQARAIREECLALLAKNIDPQVHKEEQERINAAKNENTFLKVAERWRENLIQ